MTAPWFKRYPDRYQQELDAFAEAGITCEPDKMLIEKGIVRLFITIERNNSHFQLPGVEEAYPLVVVYPDSYPWFRPEVYAFTLELARHQHMANKGLCLLPRGTQHWRPSLTVVDLLKSQFPLVLEKGVVTDEETVRADEMEQAEPYSEYFNYQLGASVLFDTSGFELPPSIKDFEWIGHAQLGLPRDAVFPSRMAVLEIHLEGGAIHQAPPEVIQLFGYKQMKAGLYRTTHRLPVKEPDEVRNWLRKGLARAGHKMELFNNNIAIRDGAYKSIIGITFPEEVEKGEQGEAWLFLVECKMPKRDAENKVIDGKKGEDRIYIARPAYISRSATGFRVPSLAPLMNKTVAIAGLGALGGYTAIELARSGVAELRLLEFDDIDPPTTVRWPLGLSAAGGFKANAIQKFIKENYPATRVIITHKRIGTARIDGAAKEPFDKHSEGEALESFLNGSDLLIDATAEEGVNHFLNCETTLRKLPFVVLYATPGAWGGMVMRSLPGTTGCWYCMKLWQTEDGTRSDDYQGDLVPPVDDKGTIQPPGCGDITFTGAGFDLQNISLAAVRLAVSTLIGGEPGGYGAMNWDWAVLHMFHKGHPVPPRWFAQPLAIHPNCPYCVSV